MSMEKTELKETVLKALRTMNDEELCRIFNYFFRQLGTFDSVNSMTCFDDDFGGYPLTEVIGMLADNFSVNDDFYAYDAGQDVISSFNGVIESEFFEDNVDNVIDEVVENWDALGSPTLTRILEEAQQ